MSSRFKVGEKGGNSKLKMKKEKGGNVEGSLVRARLSLAPPAVVDEFDVCDVFRVFPGPAGFRGQPDGKFGDALARCQLQVEDCFFSGLLETQIGADDFVAG